MGDFIYYAVQEVLCLFRGGSPVEGVMPYTLIEYKIVKNKIKLVNSALWMVYDSDRKEYYLNGKPCSANDYNKLEKARKKAIDFCPNSIVNQKNLRQIILNIESKWGVYID